MTDRSATRVRRALQRPGIRLLLVMLGALLGQFLLFGSSLTGQKVLLPLDLLADGYLPPEMAPPGPPHNDGLADIVTQFAPWTEFAVDEVRAGRLPLWNPYNYCGAPFLAANQTAVFSPFRLPHYLLDHWIAWAWAQAMKAVLIAVGGYLFFRRVLRVRFGPAWFGAMALPLSGYMILWLGFPLSAVFLWLPWLLWSVHLTVWRPAGWGPLALAVVTALALLSGHAATAGQMLLASGLWALYTLGERAWWLRGRWGWSTAWRGVAVSGFVLGLGWGIGIGLSGLQTLPTLEYLPMSARLEQRAAGTVETPPVGLAALPRSVLPWSAGSWLHGHEPISAVHPSESSRIAYAGFILTLVAGAWAFSARGRRRRMHAMLAILVVLGFTQVLAIPGLSGLLEQSPLEVFRNNRLTVWSGFGLLALAVAGLDRLSKRGALPLAPQLLYGIVIVGLGIWSWVRCWSPPEAVAESDRAVFQVAQAAGVVLAGLSVGLLAVRWWLNRRPGRGWIVVAVCGLAEMFTVQAGVFPQTDAELYFPELPVMAALSDADPFGRATGMGVFPPSTPLPHRVYTVTGYDAVDPEPMIALLRESQHPAAPPPPPYAESFRWLPDPSPLTASMSLRYFVYQGDPPAGVEPFWRGRHHWVQQVRSMPRVYVPRRWAVEPDAERRLARLSDPRYRPDEWALIEQPLKGSPAGPSQGTARMIQEQAKCLVIEANMVRPGLVVIADSHHPGWRVWVDDHRAEALRVNHAFRGVWVPTGRHRIEWRYEPTGFRRGLWLSTAAAVFAGLWAVVGGFWRRKSAPKAGNPLQY